jgi:hypothetical protein
VAHERDVFFDAEKFHDPLFVPGGIRRIADVFLAVA